MPTEFFYEENGKPQDRDLHKPILAEGDHARAFWCSTYPFLKRQDWTEAQIAKTYPELYAKGRGD
jgi:hypothetical protein